MRKNHSLYFLICPIENIVRYVGISQDPYVRLIRGHLTSDEGNPHKWRWIQKLKSNNLVPRLEVVREGLTMKVACQREIELISIMRSLIGRKLTNIHEGGGVPPSHGGWKDNPERKERASLRMKKLWESDLYRENKSKEFSLSNSREGNPNSKLTTKSVLKIKALISEGVKQRDIAKRFGVTPATITDIKKGRSWKNVL